MGFIFQTAFGQLDVLTTNPDYVLVCHEISFYVTDIWVKAVLAFSQLLASSKKKKKKTFLLICLSS